MKTTLKNIDFINSSISKFILPAVRPKNNSTILRKLLDWFASSQVPVIKRYFDYSTEEINILKQGIKKFPKEVLKSINTAVNNQNLTDYYSPDSIEQQININSGSSNTWNQAYQWGNHSHHQFDDIVENSSEDNSIKGEFSYVTDINGSEIRIEYNFDGEDYDIQACYIDDESVEIEELTGYLEDEGFDSEDFWDDFEQEVHDLNK